MTPLNGEHRGHDPEVDAQAALLAPQLLPPVHVGSSALPGPELGHHGKTISDKAAHPDEWLERPASPKSDPMR